MPPVIADPTPDWMKPEHASVFDSSLTKAMRMIAHAIGADNPTAQVLALMAPLVPEGTEQGGIAGAIQRLVKKAEPIKAYHGSPHDFEKFSMDKIGTGEGAQAYGHGLYFAENPATAQEYKRVLGNRAFKVGDRELVSPMGGSTRALDMQTRGENIAAQALDDALNAQSSAPGQFAASRLRSQKQLYPEESAHIDEALNVIAEWQRTGETHKIGGKMYEVAIHADPQDFLDWDKPLSQQPEAVKYVLGHVERPTQAETDAVFALAKQRGVPPASLPEYKALEAQLDAAAKAERDYPNGRAIYNQFMNDQRDVAIRQGDNAATTLPASQSAASQELRGMGIPGIKYLDQGSRSAGEGTRNYVVFDDQIVDILRKYGLLPPLAAPLVQHAIQPQTAEAQP